jgi:hypothetical protein
MEQFRLLLRQIGSAASADILLGRGISASFQLIFEIDVGRPKPRAFGSDRHAPEDRLASSKFWLKFEHASAHHFDSGRPARCYRRSRPGKKGQLIREPFMFTEALATHSTSAKSCEQHRDATFRTNNRYRCRGVLIGT